VKQHQQQHQQQQQQKQQKPDDYCAYCPALALQGRFLGPLFSYQLGSCHGGDIKNEM
jgi:hypothetical protein